MKKSCCASGTEDPTCACLLSEVDFMQDVIEDFIEIFERIDAKSKLVKMGLCDTHTFYGFTKELVESMLESSKLETV